MMAILSVVRLVDHAHVATDRAKSLVATYICLPTGLDANATSHKVGGVNTAKCLSYSRGSPVRNSYGGKCSFLDVRLRMFLKCLFHSLYLRSWASRCAKHKAAFLA